MTSYQMSERINAQDALWTVANAAATVARVTWPVVRWVAMVAFAVVVGVVWATYLGVEAVCRFVYADRAALLYAGRVLAISAGWMAVLVGAVVLSVLYWHIVLAAGVGALAMWVTYPRPRPHSL